MLIYSFITDYQAFSLRCKGNTTRDKNETKVGKQSANLGKNNEPIQNRLSFLIDCKSVILHHLTILSFPMVRPAWDNWWTLQKRSLPQQQQRCHRWHEVLWHTDVHGRLYGWQTGHVNPKYSRRYRCLGNAHAPKRNMRHR